MADFDSTLEFKSQSLSYHLLLLALPKPLPSGLINSLLNLELFSSFFRPLWSFFEGSSCLGRFDIAPSIQGEWDCLFWLLHSKKIALHSSRFLAVIYIYFIFALWMKNNGYFYEEKDFNEEEFNPL